MSERHKTACYLCSDLYRTDSLIRHILTHKKDLVSVMNPACRAAAIERKLPMVFYHGEFVSRRMGYNEKKVFCVCLICEEGKHARSHKTSPQVFFQEHQSTDCMNHWDEVAELFGAPPPPPEPPAPVIDPRAHEHVLALLREAEDKHRVLAANYERLKATSDEQSRRINDLSQQNRLLEDQASRDAPQPDKATQSSPTLTVIKDLVAEEETPPLPPVKVKVIRKATPAKPREPLPSENRLDSCSPAEA